MYWIVEKISADHRENFCVQILYSNFEASEFLSLLSKILWFLWTKVAIYLLHKLYLEVQKKKKKLEKYILRKNKLHLWEANRWNCSKFWKFKKLKTFG